MSSYKTGSLFFLLSRIVGASARLYIVTMVVQVMICDSLGIPFVLTAVLILVLIALYSATGGIATIVITDTLQTVLMLSAAIMAFLFVGKEVVTENNTFWSTLRSHSQWHFIDLDGPKSWWRQLFGEQPLPLP